MDAAAELGRNPVSKHQIQPEYGDEQAGAGRDGTAEPVSRDQTLRHARGQGNIFFLVQLTTSRIGNLTRLIHTLLYVMTIHTYLGSGPPHGTTVSLGHRVLRLWVLVTRWGRPAPLSCLPSPLFYHFVGSQALSPRHPHI